MKATFGKRTHMQADTAAPSGSPVKLAVVGVAAALAVCVGAVMMFAIAPQDVLTSIAQVASPTHWVTTQRLARHTCAAANCGVVGEYFYREGLNVLEEKNGFGRTTKYYDASCTKGSSDYVDSGPGACSNVNGITDGKFAEWVEMSALSTERPADPSKGATGTAAIIGGSDDFNMYRPQFVQAADKLIAQGLCTADELREFGGFWASMHLRPRKAYFAFCGNGKVYLDVKTGEIWRDH